MPDRIDVQFPAAGPQCAAWLYLPEAEEPRPVIVMGHGLGAVREMRLDAYAERFRAAGYACLVFDYRNFGASEGEPRQLLDIKSQLRDWAAALDFVRSRPEVDGSSVVLWGSSFGGGHALAAAAADGAASAVISQCPFTDGLASTLAMDPRSSTRVTARALRDRIGSWSGRAPRMVPTSGPPRSVALMTAPDAMPGFLQLVPEGMDFRNEVAARVALDVIRYYPGRRAGEIECPILFCVCEADSVAPAKATLRHARKAPRGEVKLYPEGHFEIYVGDAFETVVGDQLEFLRRHLPVG